MKTWKNVFWVSILTILYITCFPINPLVLTGVVKTDTCLITTIIGWMVWVFGMVLVMAPIVMFPRCGGVPKGKSFVNTTRIVNTGIYSVIRHPQYTGGIYAIFIPTLLWYPHWIFFILGLAGTILTYYSIKTEDKLLIEKFGHEYAVYIEKVPAMNFVAGIYRSLRYKNRLH